MRVYLAVDLCNLISQNYELLVNHENHRKEATQFGICAKNDTPWFLFGFRTSFTKIFIIVFSSFDSFALVSSSRVIPKGYRSSTRTMKRTYAAAV